MAKQDNIATVLAFEKKLVPSDGFMYGTTWEQRHNPDHAQVLNLQEKSLRGTISNRLKPATRRDPQKLNAEVEKPNLQKVDSCALGTDQDTLKLQFTLKILSGVQNPSACNNQYFNESYTQAAKNYIETEGFDELAKRYAMNIANGRFLWRNRIGAENIEVQVNVIKPVANSSWTFDASQLSIRNFDACHPDIDQLAKHIAKALSGQSDFLLLEINAYAQVGKAQDVYPSEELILDKNGHHRNGKSRILYQVNQIAAMHSQKIGNALRTIDTWYPDYDTVNTGPIAVEPYGAVTNLGIAYRNPKAKSDFYTLFDRFARGESLECKNDEHFVMATLVRGGVFGESSKD